MNQSLTRKTLIAAAIAATLGLAACGDNRDNTPRTSSTTPPASTATTPSDRVTADASTAANRAGNAVERAGDQVAAAADKAGDQAGDAATTAKVKARLMAEPGIDSLQIDVDTSNGQVTLTGEADTPQNRARAKELASSIEGVTGVVDRMTVKRGS